MKIEKEIRKRSLIILKPSVQREAARLALLRNVSFSRLIENLLIREIENNEKAKRKRREGQK